MASSAGFEQLAARFLTPTERQVGYKSQAETLKIRIDQQTQQLKPATWPAGESPLRNSQDE